MLNPRFRLGCVEYVNAKPLIGYFDHMGNDSPVDLLLDVRTQRIAGRQIGEDEARVAQHDRQEVVEVVGNTAGETADPRSRAGVSRTMPAAVQAARVAAIPTPTSPAPPRARPPTTANAPAPRGARPER